MPSIRQAVAAIPVRGRSTASGFNVRAVAALALYGIKLPDDPPRLALDRIDADPGDYIADVRRQLAQKRGITDPHAIASIDPDGEIERSIIDVESYLDKHKARCPECFPLPKRHGLSPIDAQQNLRRHLREKMQSPEYVVRRLGVADEVLSVIERTDFVERCRAEGESADEKRLGIVAVVRSIVAEVSSEPLPAKPTADMLPESMTLHRRHVDRVKHEAEMLARVSACRFPLSQIVEALGKGSEKNVGLRLDAEGVKFYQQPSKAKRNTAPRLYAWADVRRVFRELPETPPTPVAKRPRKDKGTKRSGLNSR